MVDLLYHHSILDCLQGIVDIDSGIFFLDSSISKENKSFYQHSLGYTSPDTSLYTFHSWNLSTIILPIHTAVQNVLAGPIHLTIGIASESSANLQICFSAVIMAHLPLQTHILPVYVTGVIVKHFLLYFWLSPISCSDTNPVYQRGISRTWASATGEKIKSTWMLSSPALTSCPVIYLDFFLLTKSLPIFQF